MLHNLRGFSILDVLRFGRHLKVSKLKARGRSAAENVEKKFFLNENEEISKIRRYVHVFRSLDRDLSGIKLLPRDIPKVNFSPLIDW